MRVRVCSGPCRKLRSPRAPAAGLGLTSSPSPATAQESMDPKKGSVDRNHNAFGSPFLPANRERVRAERGRMRESSARLARISHQLTVEAHHRPAITSSRLLTVLNVGFKYARIVQETGRRAARALYWWASPALRLARWVESRTGAGALDASGVLVPFPVPAHRTGRADFPHPALRPASSLKLSQAADPGASGAGAARLTGRTPPGR